MNDVRPVRRKNQRADQLSGFNWLFHRCFPFRLLKSTIPQNPHRINGGVPGKNLTAAMVTRTAASFFHGLPPRSA
jgi:hypothetical protein